MKILFLILFITLFVSCGSNKAEKCFYHEKEKRYNLKEKDNCITLSYENILLGTKKTDAFISKAVIKDGYYNQHNLGEVSSKIGFFTLQDREKLDEL